MAQVIATEADRCHYGVMALRPMTSFAVSCDWRGCSASADAAPTPAEAEIAWHREGGMKFLAGRYGGLWDDPVEYLCGKHWHQREGSYHKGPLEVSHAG